MDTKEDNAMEKFFSVSFICRFVGNETRHRQRLTVDEIGKWIDAYKFTHPGCQSITAKIWFKEPEEVKDNANG